MDGSLQLNKQTNKQNTGLKCISLLSALIYGVGFKGNWRERSLTLIRHNQRELLHHGRQQLHHGLYVLSAGKGIRIVRLSLR